MSGQLEVNQLRLRLADDTMIVPVSGLSPELAKKLEAEDGDFAVFRPGGRSLAKVVSADFAEFLTQFDKPIGVAEAVLRYSKQSGVEPEALLDEAFPILEKLMRASFLVFEGESAGEKRGDRGPLTEFKDYGIVRPVQMLNDVDVYCARTKDGRVVALKVTTAPDKSIRNSVLREAGTLRSLHGSGVPAVIEDGEFQGHAYLVTEWISGVPIDRAADAIRIQGGDSQDENLLNLCIDLVGTYARFHDLGVLHGDVHPRNVLVSAGGKTTVIDFGLSRNEQTGDRVHRGGVGFYYEPEYAEAWLGKKKAPVVTELGEQYSLAVLLYRIVTGHWYLPFSFDKQQAFQQILEQRTAAFAAVGCQAWPDLESVLGKALSKFPQDRYASLGDLGEALRAVGPARSNTSSSGGMLEIEDFVSTNLAWLAKVGFEVEAERAPRASVNIGLAGTAYGIYRLALNNRSPELLVLADVLAEKAESSRKNSDAFWSPETGVTEDVVTSQSLLHAGPGVTATRAFIAHARGDVFVLSNSIRQYIEESRGAEKLDFAFGRAGILATCSNLLRVASCNPLVNTADLREFASGVEQSLLQKLSDAWKQQRQITGHLGIAHGWAGYLYGILKWQGATGSGVPAIVLEWLAALAAIAEPHDRGSRWPRKLPAQRSDYLASWCNGTAGFVHLWLEAHRRTGDPAFLGLTEAAAWSTWDSTEPGGDLCCGSAGRAYALLAFAEATGNSVWRDRATALAHLAVRDIPHMSLSKIGLYKGPIGVLVLSSDLLTSPGKSSMPFFGDEP